MGWEEEVKEKGGEKRKEKPSFYGLKKILHLEGILQLEWIFQKLLELIRKKKNFCSSHTPKTYQQPDKSY